MQHGLIFNLNNTPFAPRSLGAYRIATYLREVGWDIEVVEYALFWKLEELQELIKSRVTSNTKFIGVSHMFNAWSPMFDDFCRWIKIAYPTIPIISGSGAKPVMETKNIDYYVSGYGEHAITELLKYITSNGPAPRFDISFFGKKKVIDAIHQYPAFPMKSLMVKYEDRDYLNPKEWLAIEFSRGCKFSCDFCNFPVLGVKGDYSRDAEDAKEQLEDAYYRFGIENYTVADETFNDRTEKITKFADVIEPLPFTPYFSGFIRGDLLVSRKLDRVELARMNFNGHFYGVESFNHASAKAVSKGMHPDKLKQGLLDVRDYFNKVNPSKYRGNISLIVGLPYETIDSLNQTYNWLITNWQQQAVTSFPLEIIRQDSVEKLSAISKDPEKYGYRILSDQEDTLRKVVSDSGYLWETDTLNVYDAHRISDVWHNLYKSSEYDFRCGVFEIQSFQLANPLLSLEQILASPTASLKTHTDETWICYVQSYINKKLS